MTSQDMVPHRSPWAEEHHLCQRELDCNTERVHVTSMVAVMRIIVVLLERGKLVTGIRQGHYVGGRLGCTSYQTLPPIGDWRGKP